MREKEDFLHIRLFQRMADIKWYYIKAGRKSHL